MPFPYRYICDLLQQLEDESRKAENKQTPAKDIIKSWFLEHRSLLDAPDNDACAILSTLLPERRTDRVYCIQVARLESLFGKALLLGASRVQELRRYLTPGLDIDLADCVEHILKRTPNAQGNNELTVEEIDDTLSCIAAACRFSSPSVRALRRTQNPGDQDKSIANIYRRLSPRDAKWFTRLVLKNYLPVILDEQLVFRCYHILLPQMMKVRADLTMTTAFLQHITQSPDDQSAIASMLKPSIGTKVGRQTWFKGRSIKHCLSMARSRDMSCEQKIDGEYCQIHINLRNRSSPIQIFSKSGKDSTEDRAALHQVIRDSLRIGRPDCPLRFGCILEGELAVYSSKENKILPFHKIRKHVSRSGTFIGTNHDSQPHDSEHLMIVYFDVLMIDDESLLGARHSERFRRLTNLITCRKGCTELVPREVISFSRPSAASKLREAFADCIVYRREGLVLKPDEPYFNFSMDQYLYKSVNIKLKKEYVQGFADVGDFAAVGASYDAAKAKEYKRSNIKCNIKWTHFYIGCLENKEKARANMEKPRFIITNIITLSEALLSTVLTRCDPSPVPFESNNSITLDFGRRTEKRPTDVFQEPVVFDMRCFSFEKEPNTNFWAMRFPSVSKMHHDRSYWDTITFTELQEVATASREAPELEDSQEMRRWVAALEKGNPQGVAVDTTSQQSTSTETRVSLVQSRDKRSEAPCALTPEPENCARALEQASSCQHDTEPPQNPLSPPRSSAIESSEHNVPIKAPERWVIKSARPKRPAESSIVAANKSRKLSHTTSVQPGSTDNSAGLPPSPSRNRKPLSQVDTNSAMEYRGANMQPRTSEGPISISSTSEPAYSPINNDCGSSPAGARDMTPNTSRPRDASSQDLDQDLWPKCSLVSKKCAFAACSVLLAPCISQYAWVADLLKEHGIDTFLTDPKSWVHTPLPATSGYKWVASTEQMKKVRVRKICLVESRRRDATIAFTGEIEAAGLKRRNGDREWVDVYDWRILEELSDIESGKKKPEMNPWRRYYVGIA